jgi:MFS family permease
LYSDTKHPVSESNNKTLTTFRALRYSSFRYLWLGQLGHSATMWMEQVVRPLLILELTGSALQVGLVVSLRMLPQLVLGLLAGVLADRYDKRFILMFSQIITLFMHIILALLLLTGYLTVWHVYVTAVISGASMAFNQPARQTLIPRLVPREMLLNAISLNTAAMNIMRILGASLAGLLLIFFDYGQVYLFNAAIYVVVIWMTYKIKVDKSVLETSSDKASKNKTTILSDLTDGFRYISHKPVLFYLIGLGLLLFIFGQPYQQVFIPLLALNVLHTGRSGAGWILAFSGIGALAGSFIIASVKQVNKRGLLLMGLLIVLGISLVLLAQSQWFPLSVLAVIIAGGANTAYMALNTLLLLEQSSPEYQGRVISLGNLNMGLVSLGALLAGVVAETLGPQSGLTVLATAFIVFTVLMFLIVRPLRKIN